MLAVFYERANLPKLYEDDKEPIAKVSSRKLEDDKTTEKSEKDDKDSSQHRDEADTEVIDGDQLQSTSESGPCITLPSEPRDIPNSNTLSTRNCNTNFAPAKTRFSDQRTKFTPTSVANLNAT